MNLKFPDFLREGFLFLRFDIFSHHFNRFQSKYSLAKILKSNSAMTLKYYSNGLAWQNISLDFAPGPANNVKTLRCSIRCGTRFRTMLELILWALSAICAEDVNYMLKCDANFISVVVPISQFSVLGVEFEHEKASLADSACRPVILEDGASRESYALFNTTVKRA